jgi:hypothetical protein
MSARSRLRLHRASIAALVIGLIGGGLVSAAVAHTVSSDGDKLLVERAGETSTIVGTLVSSVQSSLATVAAATSASADRGSAFEAVASSPAGTTFTGMALLQRQGAAVTVTARHGSLLALPASSATPVASVVQAATQPASGLVLTGFLGSGAQRHLGVLLGPPLAGPDSALYAEVALPAGTVVPSTDPSTADLDYGLYLGTETEAGLVFTNTTSRPISGTRAVVVSTPGSSAQPQPRLDTNPGGAASAAGDLVLVVGAKSPLVGSFESELPWIIIGIGLVIVVGFVALLEATLRRRDVALGLAATIERDASERERLQRQLQQTQRLESLGQLAGGVAHDFNNMLAIILSYAAFVEEEVGRAVADDAARWRPVQSDVQQIEKAAESAARLTHQLLAFARREIVDPRALSLNDLVLSMEELLRRTIGEHVILTTSLDPDLRAVNADRGQLEQVLVNLAVNARDAMPDGGTLHIDTANVAVDEEHAASRDALAPGEYVRLRVADTGKGMTKDVLARAFDPFYTTKPTGQGTGLGLATVYGVIGQAGGHAQIYSEDGLGTTVTALLPAVMEGADEHAAAASETRGGGGETVLVVEDETAILDVACRILTRNGYQVLSAASASDAIAVAEDRTAHIDLLLTDVVMPKMLGKEVATRVTALRPEVRVLFMSGYAEEVLATQGTLDAGVHLVEKPFSEAGLVAKVAEVLDGGD